MFSIPKQVLIFLFKFILSSANAFNLDQSKILSFGKELSCVSSTAAKSFSSAGLENRGSWFESVIFHQQNSKTGIAGLNP